jgi:DNA-binding XRE family transcriptional regulator
LDRKTFVSMVSGKMRLIRNEYNLNQANMAELIGLSKKTLVQIEKERGLASWTVVLAICALFRESDVLKMIIGDDPLDAALAIAFKDVPTPKEVTGGGLVFWKTVRKEGKFIMQRHVFTGYYRIIDGHFKRWASAFDKTMITHVFENLIKEGYDIEEDIDEVAL